MENCLFYYSATTQYIPKDRGATVMPLKAFTFLFSLSSLLFF